MKRVVVVTIAMIALLTVGTTIYAAAATMNVTSSTLDKAQTSITYCNGSNPVSATYDTTADPDTGDLSIIRVKLGGVMASCDGGHVTVVLADSAGVARGTGNAIVAAPADGSVVTVDVNPTPLANVTTTHVALLT
jgi:hypothetical protein